MEMEKFFALFVTAFSCSFLACSGLAQQDACRLAENVEDGVKLELYVYKDSNDDWPSSFFPDRNASFNSAGGLHLDLKNSVVECGRKDVMRIQAVLKADNYMEKIPPTPDGLERSLDVTEISALRERKEEHTDKLMFQERTGKNVVLLKDRRTAYRKDPYDDSGYAGLITNRPLKNDELFQVQLDKIINLYTTGGVYIGVTLQPPEDIESSVSLRHKRNGTWTLYKDEIRLDTETIKQSYPLNGQKFRLDDRIGVMRRSNTSLHFFLNGVDMGEAAKYVPGPLYGLVEVVNYAAQISIVD